MTNKRLPGNPTRSYRTRHALRVIGEEDTWKGHDPQALQEILESLGRLRDQALDIIED